MNIVRYSRNARRVAPYVLRATPAYKYVKAAQTMYNVGKRAAPYASAAIDAWKSRPRKKTKYQKTKSFQDRLGEPVGTGTAKRNGFTPAIVNVTGQALQAIPLISLTKSSTDAIDQRQRDMVNYRGIKVCVFLRNLDVTGEPMYCNWAIISPKASAGSALAPTDFFRGDGASRGKDFIVGSSWMDTHCMPINTDVYNVLHHRRFVLDGVFNAGDALPATTNDVTNTGTKGTLLFEKYIPVNRQLRFDSGQEYPTTPNIFMCFWCQRTDENTALVSVRYEYKVIQFFKEPDSCC